VVSGNIFLVGPMGSGKSTIGRQLAKALKRPFFDSDKEIEKRTGVTISWIFEMEGEEGFRQREQQIIAELTAKQNIVLATGGGAILKEDNRKLLKSRGSVVYLSSSVEQLYRRTSKDKSRPLLQTDDPKKQIAILLAKRDPLYKSVADVVIRTAKQSIQKTVSHVIKKLESLEPTE
jgi:shikimate kinase